MKGFGVALLCCFLLVNVCSARQAPISGDSTTDAIQATVNQFFGLWSLGNCTLWVSSFLPNGEFFHPNYPDGVSGSAALMKFCATNNENPSSTFRQDGALVITVSGGLYFALAPYAYADTNPDGSVFINTGWESLVLVSDASGKMFIQSATEFFARNSQPAIYTNQ